MLYIQSWTLNFYITLYIYLGVYSFQFLTELNKCNNAVNSVPMSGMQERCLLLSPAFRLNGL